MHKLLFKEPVYSHKWPSVKNTKFTWRLVRKNVALHSFLVNNNNISEHQTILQSIGCQL
jgi:hypothetical protein